MPANPRDKYPKTETKSIPFGMVQPTKSKECKSEPSEMPETKSRPSPQAVLDSVHKEFAKDQLEALESIRGS